MIGQGGDPRPLAAGDVVGNAYRVVRSLGGGGMGAVYLGTAPDGSHVVIKTMHAHLASHPEMLARFELEARATAALRHPCIVRVLAYTANTNEPPCLVMEHVTGRSLSEVLREGPLDTERAVHIAVQLLGALETAHSAKLVHRDLKPGNVMVLDEAANVKLLDFGISRVMDEARRTQLTQTGQILGTPGYMAPEQATGAGIDARTDVYAVGLLMYRALTGRLPFEGKGAALLQNLLRQPPIPITTLRPNIDARIAACVHTAIAKNPDERFQSAAQMRAALRPSRLGWRVWVGLVAVAVLVGLGSFALLSTGAEPGEHLALEVPIEVPLSTPEPAEEPPAPSVVAPAAPLEQERTTDAHTSMRTKMRRETQAMETMAPLTMAPLTMEPPLTMAPPTAPIVAPPEGARATSGTLRLMGHRTGANADLFLWFNHAGYRAMPCYQRIPEVLEEEWHVVFDASGRPTLELADLRAPITRKFCLRDRLNLISSTRLQNTDQRMRVRWTPMRSND